LHLPVAFGTNPFGSAGAPVLFRRQGVHIFRAVACSKAGE